MSRTWDEIMVAFAGLVAGRGLAEKAIRVQTTPLPRGPEGRYPPGQQGRFALRAEFEGHPGVAFSPLVARFEGTLSGLLSAPLHGPADRALVLAALNAVTRWAGLSAGTLPCAPEAPRACALELSQKLGTPPSGPRCACIVGFQSYLVKALAEHRPVIEWSLPGQPESALGVPLPLAEALRAPEALGRCQTLLLGGGALVYGAFDGAVAASRGARVVTFGVAIAGAATLLGWDHHCPYGRPAPHSHAQAPGPLDRGRENQITANERARS